jgi:hypothetical protein
MARSVDSIASSLTALELEKHNSSGAGGGAGVSLATTPHGSLIFGIRKSATHNSAYAQRRQSRGDGLLSSSGGFREERSMSNFFGNVFRSSTTTPSASFKDLEAFSAYHATNSFLSTDAR